MGTVHKLKKWLRERLVELQSSREVMRMGWRTPRVDSLKLAELAYTRIENAQKVRKKTYIFIYVTVICTTAVGTTNMRLCEPL